MLSKCTHFVIWSVICLSILIFSGCNKQTSNIHLENQLISQIDKNADDYLANWDPDNYTDPIGEDWHDLISMKSLHYGNFTSSESLEILVLFHVDAQHVAGLDRTIALIVDADTLNHKTQRSFAADSVSIRLLPDSSGKENILAIMSTTNQGMNTYTAELFEVPDNEWITKPVFDEVFKDTFSFSLASDGTLQVFNVQYKQFPKPIPTYEYQYALFWNPEKAKFIRSESE